LFLVEKTDDLQAAILAFGIASVRGCNTNFRDMQTMITGLFAGITNVFIMVALAAIKLLLPLQGKPAGIRLRFICYKAFGPTGRLPAPDCKIFFKLTSSA